MANKNGTCLLCGTKYEVCKFCQRTKIYYPWKIDFDTPQHFQIYAIVSDFRNDVLTSAETKERLEHMGVTVDDIANFVPSVQATLKPVFGIDEKSMAKKELSEQVAVQYDEPHRKTTKPFKGRKK